MPAHPEKSAKTLRSRAILPNKLNRHAVTGGILLPLLMGFAVIVGLLALLLSRSASQAQYYTFRHDQDRWLRRWAEMAVEEAFIRCEAALKKPDHPARRCLLDDHLTEYLLELPLTTAEMARRSGLGVGKVQATAALRPLDSRKSDSNGYRFFAGELVGTFEIQATISFSDERRQGLSLRRHFPYRVTSLAHPRTGLESREGYYGAFLQDYVLFVRDGLAEFRQTRGSSLHAPESAQRRIRVELASLPEEQRGKIFFGGTRDPEAYSSAKPGETPLGNYVFINVPASWSFLLPEAGKVLEIPLTLSDCLSLVPRFAPFRDGLSGLQGTVQIRPIPVVGSETASEKMAYNPFPGLEGAERNLDPPCLVFDSAILRDPRMAEQVFEGAIRQRFLCESRLTLDFSRLGTPLPASIDGISGQEGRLVFEFGRHGAQGARQPERELWQRLMAWNQDRLGPLGSAGNAEFLLCAGQRWHDRQPWKAFHKPRLYNSRGELIDARESGGGGLRP
ncbi:MAG TPA: hypothetical protein PKO06_19280, partial [Candidatus Ozemobacteraceae bacterium]|nr:hypothetical protein [Candidatus Ozemobacteraceae bacterium]